MRTLIINNKETNYLINELGKIYNKKTNKELTGCIKKNGYKSVKLTIEGKKKDFLVHRLVALTFLPNPSNLPQVNHKDRNKINNEVSNLEWINVSNNVKHSYLDNTRKKRQKIRDFDLKVIENGEWRQYLDTNYYVSINGECVNVKTKKYLNPSGEKDNYLRYHLYINKKRTSVLAHRMVYSSFYPDRIILDSEQINHIDGNKHNNNLNNLEKITRSENMRHSCYVLKNNIKPVIKYDLDMNKIEEYESISQAARENNISNSGICQVLSGKIKTYKGFYWKYKKV